MTERGYVPGKVQKSMVHAVEKAPLETKKDLHYSKKPVGPPRAPEESTLLKGIHNLKEKKKQELENEEPSFHPEINQRYQPKKNTSTSQERRTAADR